jgi:hypothetical protein
MESRTLLVPTGNLHTVLSIETIQGETTATGLEVISEIQSL